MVVLITGATGGLGTAVVKTFLESGAAAVFGAALSWQGEQIPEGRFHPIEADLTTAAGCEQVVARTGPVDALIHCVGAFAGGDPVGETDEKTWDFMMNVNLRSAFLMCRAVLPGMLKAGSGRIVAVGSRTGTEPAAGLSAYGASKAGLVALIRTIALETKGTKVTANVIMPSVIDTAANRAAMPKADPRKWVRPESIAGLLLWLASQEAADVSGAVIPIYGAA
ncbi:MAG TPA: SDR family NAD(P)-dependent oxidoreductase [Bryobacteraceae bacterium]|nr:SDR family NAD(P)-dependent oxidoreductase [Bryobacteraceae bacterium]